MMRAIFFILAIFSVVFSQDIDRDGIVNYTDRDSIVAYIGTAHTGLSDITDDGKVSFQDHLVWASHLYDTLQVTEHNADSLRIQLNKISQVVDTLRIEYSTVQFALRGQGTILVNLPNPPTSLDTIVYTGGKPNYYVSAFYYESHNVFTGWTKGIHKHISTNHTVVEKYRRLEIPIVYSTYSGNPFTIVFDGQFVHKSTNDTILMPGYYAGNDSFRIDFMPIHEGFWYYTTISSDPNLNGISDSIICSPTTLPGMMLPDGKKWVFSESSDYVVPMGFRMEFHYDTFSTANFVKACNELADSVRGTEFETRLFDKENWYGRTNYIFEDWTNLIFDTTHFARTAKWMDSLTVRGLGAHIMFYVDSPQPPWKAQSDTEAIAIRYVVARTAAHPIVRYNTGIDIWEYRTDQQITWFCDTLRALDPYGHPVSSRYRYGYGGQDANETFASRSEPLQARLTGTYPNMIDNWNENTIAISQDDAWGENRDSHPTKNHTPADIRRAFWKCAVLGGVGGLVRPGRADDHNGDFIANVFLDDLESEQWLRFVNPFIRDTIGVEYGNMVLDQSLVSGTQCYAAAGPTRNVILYFLVGANDTYDTGGGGDITLVLTDESGTWDAKWFDPRNGTSSVVSGSPFTGGSNYVVTPPSTDDWVMWLVKRETE